MLVAFVASLAPAATGVSFHELLGIALAATAFVHIIVNWDWTLHVIARMVARIRTSSKMRLLIDALLFGCGVTVTLSGLLISEPFTSTVGVTATQSPAWSVVHAISARAAVPLLAVHLGMHVSWLSGTVRSVLPSRARAVGMNS